ncbi:MAG: hypothetical protein K2K20_04925, partial [Lachnospiraceae bacterium]|nr:hypothetical protein [Lachnospiraceae bacterium]
MKKGEIYQGIVLRMDFPNKGIVIVDGVNVTVKNALPGQTVSFRITKKRNGQAEGKLLEVVEKAPCEKEYLCRLEDGKGEHVAGCTMEDGREEHTASGYSEQGGICRYAGICGGCLYQGFPYEEQLKIKEGQVLKLLGAYLGGVKPGSGDTVLKEASCNGDAASVKRDVDVKQDANARQNADGKQGSADETEVMYDGIMPSPKQYGYRNKMEFTFGDEMKG